MFTRSLRLSLGTLSGVLVAVALSRPGVAQSEVCVSQAGSPIASLGQQSLLREVTCPAGVSGRCWVPGPAWSQFSAMSPSQAGLCAAIVPPLALCQVQGNTVPCPTPPVVNSATSAGPIVTVGNPLLFFVRSPNWVGKWWVQSQWPGYPDRGSRWEFAVVQTPTGSGCVVQMRGGDTIPCVVAGDVLTWRGTMEGHLMDVRLTRQGNTLQGEFVATSLTTGQPSLAGEQGRPVTGTLVGGAQNRWADLPPWRSAGPHPGSPHPSGNASGINAPVYVVP